MCGGNEQIDLSVPSGGLINCASLECAPKRIDGQTDDCSWCVGLREGRVGHGEQQQHPSTTSRRRKKEAAASPCSKNEPILLIKDVPAYK